LITEMQADYTDDKETGGQREIGSWEDGKRGEN